MPPIDAPLPDHGDPVAALAACGPRVGAHAAAVESAVAAVRDGTRRHYGDHLAGASDADADADLLEGDARYADGLSRLAELGDLVAITELAETISLVAAAHAVGDDELVHAVWHAAAAGIGWGSEPDLLAARGRARAGETGAADALLACARQICGDLARGR